MTDPEPTPREEAALSRLLRDARHEGPVPPEVASRTEDTLAGLRSERTRSDDGDDGQDRHGGHGVVTRGAARRRRRAAALLIAAVSVVVVGIGVGQVLRPATQDAETTSAASADALARDVPPDRAADERAPGQEQPGGPAAGLTERGDGSSEGPSATDASPRPGDDRAVPVDRLALVDDPPVVREARFPRDVRVVRRLQQQERAARGTTPRDPAAGFTCDRADWGPGRAVAVLYERAPAVLVLRPATRATQVADLLECGGGGVLRSLTLPR